MAESPWQEMMRRWRWIHYQPERFCVWVDPGDDQIELMPIEEDCTYGPKETE